MHCRTLFCAIAGVAMAAPMARAGPTFEFDLSSPLSKSLGPVAHQVGILSWNETQSVQTRSDFAWVQMREQTRSQQISRETDVALSDKVQAATALPGPGSAALAGAAFLAAVGRRKRG